MLTKQELKEELKQSMMARDELKTSVLRMLLSGVTYYEINKGGAGYEASAEDVLAVVQKEVKQRKDSIESFEKAKREDLADKEKKELILLEKYLPEQMGEPEIKKLVVEAISKTGAKTMADIRKVMGILMPQLKGKADGSLVSKLVKESLTGNS